MAIRAKTTAVAQKYALSNITFPASSDYIPLSLSRSRTTFYATSLGVNSRRSKLSYSTDAGATWTLIKDFDTLVSFGDIVGFLEKPDGEVLIGLSAYGSFGTKIYKSTGWASNPSTATWTLTLTMNTSMSGSYSLNIRCLGTNGVLLASESGAQTVAGASMVSGGSGYTTATLAATSGGSGESLAAYCYNGQVYRVAILNGGSGHTNGTFHFSITGDGLGADWTYTVSGGVIQGVQTSAARRLWISTDIGNTWTKIFDIYTTPSFKYGIGMHLHGVAYDEDWDRIYILTGDNTGDGTKASGYPTNTQALYSDDRGTTWNWLAGSSYAEGNGILAQYTSIRCLPGLVVLGGDAHKTPFASMIYPKTGYRTLGSPLFGPGFVMENVVFMGGLGGAYSSDNHFPMFFLGSYYGTVNTYPVILYTHDKGYTWRELWRETDFVSRPLAAGCGITSFLGPDINNKMLGYYNGKSLFIKADLITN